MQGAGAPKYILIIFKIYTTAFLKITDKQNFHKQTKIIYFIGSTNFERKNTSVECVEALGSCNFKKFKFFIKSIIILQFIKILDLPLEHYRH